MTRKLALADVHAMTGGEIKGSALSAYERADRRPTVVRVQRLAEVYDVPLSTLIPPDADKQVDPRRQLAEQLVQHIMGRLEQVGWADPQDGPDDWYFRYEDDDISAAARPVYRIVEDRQP